MAHGPARVAGLHASCATGLERHGGGLLYRQSNTRLAVHRRDVFARRGVEGCGWRGRGQAEPRAAPQDTVCDRAGRGRTALRPSRAPGGSRSLSPIFLPRPARKPWFAWKPEASRSCAGNRSPRSTRLLPLAQSGSGMSVLLSANGGLCTAGVEGPPGTVDGDDGRPSALRASRRRARASARWVSATPSAPGGSPMTRSGRRSGWPSRSPGGGGTRRSS